MAGRAVVWGRNEERVLAAMRDAVPDGYVIVDRARFERLLSTAREYAREHYGFESSLGSDDPYTNHFEPGDLDPV
jgi:hypothetical protein